MIQLHGGGFHVGRGDVRGDHAVTVQILTGQDLNGDGVIAPDIAPADVEASAVELDHVDESAEVEQEED